MFVRFSKLRPAEIPESVPAIDDFAKTQEQKDLIAVLDAADLVGRPFVMSRQVPAERLDIMRKAFDAAMRDPGLRAEAQKAQLTLSPLTGLEAEDIIGKMRNVSPAIIEKAREIYE